MAMLPFDSFLGTFARQHQNFAGGSGNTLALPECNATFVGLLCRFLCECQRSSAQRFNEYQVTFESFYDAFTSGGAASHEAASRQYVQERRLAAQSGEASESDPGLDRDDWSGVSEDGDQAFAGVVPFDEFESVDSVFHSLIRKHREDAKQICTRQPELLAGYNGALMRHLDVCAAMGVSRVQLILGSGYLEFPPEGFESAGSDAHENPLPLERHASRWIARLSDGPSVAHELRVKLVGATFPGEPEGSRYPACLMEESAEDNELTLFPRLVPGFTLWGRMSAEMHCTGWVRLCEGAADRSDKLEARLFCLSNVPRRRRLAPLLESAFLALGDQTLWAQLNFHGCDDLTFAIARGVVERQSKLKPFLATKKVAQAEADKGQNQAAVERLLKQWPGKDAVQALAVWWMAATLCDGHAYTEPELYAAIENLCAMQADFAVIRKEMVRRGFLTPPEIVANTDRTTTTYYRVSMVSMRAALQGEWRTKGIF